MTTDGTFRFKVTGFHKLSLSFILVVIISLLLSYFGLIYFLMFLCIPFIVYPRLYKQLRLYKIPLWGLVLATNRFRLQRLLSILPGVQLGGEWYLEQHSEEKKLSGLKDVFRFIINHWFVFFVMNTGFLALGIRVYFFLLGDPDISTEFPEGVGFLELTSTGLVLAGMLVPVVLAFYFVWVWVWEDAELKMKRTRVSSITAEPEILRSWEAADSVRNLVGLVVGIPSLVWVADKATSDEFSGSNGAGGLTGAIVLMVVFFIFTGGPSILMGVMYYRSGVHEEFVNLFREEVRDHYSHLISVGTLTYETATSTTEGKPMPIDSSVSPNDDF